MSGVCSFEMLEVLFHFGLFEPVHVGVLLSVGLRCVRSALRADPAVAHFMEQFAFVVPGDAARFLVDSGLLCVCIYI